ncbi:BR-signaling kinase 2 [Forsythia ovata]|uniref:BR-signaling kinase 2 n=1 Tax=Forsythia ovata TaxID=205694 RepID=A0ABD1QQU6_9LAMI
MPYIEKRLTVEVGEMVEREASGHEEGRVIPASVIYSYGTILLDLLTGKHIPPLQITMFAWFSGALFLLRGKNLSLLMDSSLRGRYRNEDATALVELASKCLQYEARDGPDIKFLFTAVTPLQKEKEVASHVLMGLTKTPEMLPPMLSPLGKACARMYLIAVQDILLKTGYEDEKGVVTKLSFHEWTQVQDRQNIKIFADTAFRGKDFRGAIAYYSTAENCMPEWPTAFYMQALALAKLELKNRCSRHAQCRCLL